MVDVKGVNFVLVEGTNARNTEKDLCNYAVCRECRGECCQGAGCVLSPEDVYVLKKNFSMEVRVRYMIHLLKRGDLSIDYWPVTDYGESARNGILPAASSLQRTGILYIRAKNKGKSIIDTEHYNWEENTPCASWSYEEGCKFPFNRRPKGGRELIPGPIPGLLCEPGYPEWVAAYEWYAFSEVMGQVYEYFRKNLT